MSKSSRLSRGDRRRNERLARLRAVVRGDHAVLAFDLAADKQVCVVVDHDSRVLARRTVPVKAWQLGEAVDWGLAQARRAGFVSVVVACEPTGHRWRVLDQLAEQVGLRLVCVQPLLVRRGREAEDFTFDKSDDKDALVIARLTTELRCYLPERADARWARLRHLGARRSGLVTDASAARQQIRDLLECSWPTVLDAAAGPFRSRSWLAAMSVAVNRIGATGELSAVRAGGWARFTAAVRRELPAWGGQRLNSKIVRAVFDAAGDPHGGVPAQRPGALERAGLILADLRRARNELATVEQRMIGVLDELELTELVSSIPGLSAVGAAAILAEAGDPARFDSARALVKHAGLCPRLNESGRFAGTSRISGRGRPGLRLAAWRAILPALRHNPVLAARYDYLTSKATNPLAPTQAHIALAASLLRQLHAVVTGRTAWCPRIAAGLLDPRRQEVSHTAA